MQRQLLQRLGSGSALGDLLQQSQAQADTEEERESLLYRVHMARRLPIFCQGDSE